MATYTPAQLLTAAGKVDYRTLGGKYSNLTPAQLVAAAQKDSVLMSKITSYVPQQSPAEIKAAAAAKAAADAKAKAAADAANAKFQAEFAAKQAEQQKAAQAAADAAAAKVAADKAAAQQAAQAKATADAKAVADKAAAVKASQEAAAKAVADKAAAQQAAKEAAAKAVADKAVADKAVADKAAEAKAAADKAAAEAQTIADAKAASAKAGQAFNADLLKATSQADIDSIRARAEAAGATLNQGYVDQATKIIQQKQTAVEKAAAAEKLATAQAGWIDKMKAATTPEQVQSIAKQGQAAGELNINQGQIDGYVRNAQAQVDQAQAVKTAEAQADWQKQIQTAASAGNVDQTQSLIDQAKAAGQWNINDAATNSYVTQAQAVIDKAAAVKTAEAQADWVKQVQAADTADQARSLIDQARAAGQWNINEGTTTGLINTVQSRVDTTTRLAEQAKTEADRQAVIANAKASSLQKAYDYASKLAPPAAAGNKFTQDGYELVGVPDDPTTEANEASWYVYNGGQMQRVGSDGQPQGGPVSPEDLNATQQQIGQNTRVYDLQQRDAAAAAELAAQNQKIGEFEKTLPDPASLPAGATRNYPGGTTYYLTPTNRATGEPGTWTKMDPNGQMVDLATGKPTTAQAYDTQLKEVQGANNQVAAAERAARAAQQQADRDSTFFDTDFGKVFTVLALAAVVGPMIGEALASGATVADAAGAAAGMAEGGATAGEIASALEASGMSAEAAATMAETATGVASGAVDVQALGAANGITAEAVSAAASSANPLAAVNSTLYELNALETAQLMSNVNPAFVSSLAPTTAGAAGGTAGSILSGASLNPITNVLTNIGITNPIISGALTGAGTGAVINAVTGKPITGDSLLMGALGGGVAGGIGSVMPDFGGGALGGAIGGAATNLGATAVVNLATGRPITLDNLASSALIGGAVGGAVGVLTDGAGNTTYQYDDGSSMTVSRTGTPVSVTDNTGANVPVGAVDRLTGEPKQLAPVEDRVGTPVAPKGPPAGTVAVQAPDGSVLYTDGQTYYTADGTVTDISNPTPGGATDTARLSEPNQQIITDATKDYGAGRIGWDEASARINQAVRNDIESGYLKNNGDGTYTAPDGVTYFMNRETGMYDAQVGKPGGTGTGPDTAPVTEVERPIAPPVINQLPVEPTPEAPVAPPAYTITQPVDTPRVPTETINQLPVAPAPTPEAPPAGPTAPVNVAPPVETPVVAPPVETPVETPVVAPPVSEPPVVTPTPGPVSPPTTTPGPVSPPTTTPGPGIIPINPPVVEPPAVVEPPVAQPPAVTPVAPPVTEPPVVQPPVTEPPVVQPPAVAPPVVEPPAVVEPPPAVVQPPAVVEPPYVPPTYPPIYVPPVETPPATRPGYGPITPLDWGRGVPLDMSGLNPGYITNVPRQYAPSGVRSQYYYGPKPYQAGTTFDPALYRSAPAAPVAPWGLQQMYNPQTQTIENLLRGVGVAAGQAPYNRPGAPKV